MSVSTKNPIQNENEKVLSEADRFLFYKALKQTQWSGIKKINKEEKRRRMNRSIGSNAMVTVREKAVLVVRVKNNQLVHFFRCSELSLPCFLAQ